MSLPDFAKHRRVGDHAEAGDQTESQHDAPHDHHSVPKRLEPFVNEDPIDQHQRCARHNRGTKHLALGGLSPGGADRRARVDVGKTPRDVAEMSGQQITEVNCGQGKKGHDKRNEAQSHVGACLRGCVVSACRAKPRSTVHALSGFASYREIAIDTRRCRQHSVRVRGPAYSTSTPTPSSREPRRGSTTCGRPRISPFRDTASTAEVHRPKPSHAELQAPFRRGNTMPSFSAQRRS